MPIVSCAIFGGKPFVRCTMKWMPTYAFVCCVGLLSGCGKEPPEKIDSIRPVRAMKVADFEGVSKRSFPGRAEATQVVDLAFRVSGPLISRPVNVGDEVSKGDVIARIDPRDFEADLRRAEGNLERARANQQRAQSDYERVSRIQETDPQAISQAAVDQSVEALAVAKADIVAFEAAADAARDAVKDTELTAPFDGTIVAIYVENFQNVRQKQMIARLLDKSKIEFTLNVPESLISMVPYVEDIRVNFDAFPGREVEAVVKEVGAEASETTRTFPVTLIMEQPEGATVLPGMAGRARGMARPPEENDVRIVVPVSAVFSPEENRGFVWMIDESGNTVSRQEVALESLGNAGFVIRDGLKPGDMIAIAGVNFLKEGQQVRPEVP